MANMHTDAQ